MRLIRTIKGKSGSLARVYHNKETSEFIYRIYLGWSVGQLPIAEGFESTDQDAYNSACLDLAALPFCDHE